MDEQEKIAAKRKETRDVVLGAVRDDMKRVRIPMYSNAWTWKVCDAGYKAGSSWNRSRRF